MNMNMSANAGNSEDVFTLVFKENRWGNDESVSGAGSALSSSNVIESVKALDTVIRELKIRSINDVPCGDFYWIPLILGRFPFVKYAGYDIVSDLIDWNRRRFPLYDFQVFDVTKSILPQADLIFCKDLFLHLHNQNIIQALCNFKKSNSRYLLVSNATGIVNYELVVDEPGQCRHVNLTSPPYDLPQPLWSTSYLSLWSLDSLNTGLFEDIAPQI